MQSVEEVAARRSNKERAVEVCGNLAAISAACGLGGEVEPSGTPPMRAGSLSCPTTAVSAMPTSSTLAFERIIGMAMASTSPLFTPPACGP